MTVENKKKVKNSVIIYDIEIKLTKMVNKINTEQKFILFTYIAEHPILANNKIKHGVVGHAFKNDMWKELTQLLNEAGPPVKESKSWRKVSCDLKYRAKKKSQLSSLAKKDVDAVTSKETLTSLNFIKNIPESEEDQIVNKSTVSAYVIIKKENLDNLSSLDNTSSIDLVESVDFLTSNVPESEIKSELK